MERHFKHGAYSLVVKLRSVAAVSRVRFSLGTPKVQIPLGVCAQLNGCVLVYMRECE
jgi:hypothetical protein